MSTRRALVQEAIHEWVRSNERDAQRMVTSLDRWIHNFPYGGLWINNGSPVACLPFPMAISAREEDFVRRFCSAANKAMIGQLQRVANELDLSWMRSHGLTDFQATLIRDYIAMCRKNSINPLVGALDGRLDFFLDILSLTGWECEENRRTAGGNGYQTTSSRWMMTTPLWQYLQRQGYNPRVYLPWPNRIQRLHQSYQAWCQRKGLEDKRPTLFVFGAPEFRGNTFTNEEFFQLKVDQWLNPDDYPPLSEIVIADQPWNFHWNGSVLYYGDRIVRWMYRAEKYERAAARGDSGAVVDGVLNDAVFMTTTPLAEFADLKVIQALWWTGGPSYLQELGLSASEADFLHALLPQAEILNGDGSIAKDTIAHPEKWVVKEYRSAGGGGDNIGPKFLRDKRVELWQSAVNDAAAQGAIRQEAMRIPTIPIMVLVDGKFVERHVRYGLDAITGTSCDGSTAFDGILSRAKVWDPSDSTPDTINVGAKGDDQSPSGFLITVRID